MKKISMMGRKLGNFENKKREPRNARNTPANRFNVPSIIEFVRHFSKVTFDCCLR